MVRWYASESVLRFADLSPALSEVCRDLMQAGRNDDGFGASSSVCLLASEVVEGRALPTWIDSETRFLVVLDVPLGAAMRIPTLLRLRKPDQRLLLTSDSGSVRRWVIAPNRSQPYDGVIDAYVVGATLTVFMGDLTIRDFPIDRVPSLRSLAPEQLRQLEVDIDGSFLTWPNTDIHLGPSQLLQAVDPSQLAEIEIERFRSENTAVALKYMREQRGLRQADIEGLSERQVSRLENAESRLTGGSAESFARSFNLTITDFLDELGSLLVLWKDEPVEGISGERDTKARTAVT
jgi:hypothetical protein